MSTLDPGKLLLGLAAAVGTALLVFARKHGVQVELPQEGDDDASPIWRAQRERGLWAGLKETDPRAAGLLAKYWAAVGLGPQPASAAWSAAFISYVVGPGGGLLPNASHIGYARSAFNARKQGLLSRYWAFEPRELNVLQPGDILIGGRGQPVGWGDVVADTGHKDTHGDLVVAALPGAVRVIGGNVSNGVTERELALPMPSRNEFAVVPAGVFAVLRRVTLPAGVA